VRMSDELSAQFPWMLQHLAEYDGSRESFVHGKYRDPVAVRGETFVPVGNNCLLITSGGADTHGK